MSFRPAEHASMPVSAISITGQRVEIASPVVRGDPGAKRFTADQAYRN